MNDHISKFKTNIKKLTELKDIISKIESKFKDAKICMTELETIVQDFLNKEEGGEIKKECDHRWTRENFSKEDDAMISMCIKCGAKFKRTLNPSSQAEDTNLL